MDNSVLPSTFVLTLLMLVGLVFFIRASVKARIQVVKITVARSEAAILQTLQEYFASRAYRTLEVKPELKQVTLEGNVRPSLGLSIFLSGLAAIGLLCLSLMLSMLWPRITSFLPGLVLLSPIAGVFYWRKAGRVETVLLKVEADSPELGIGEFRGKEYDQEQSTITVTAHRDELAELQRFLSPEIV